MDINLAELIYLDKQLIIVIDEEKKDVSLEGYKI